MNKYEALGRYIEAKELYEKAQRARDMFTANLQEQFYQLKSTKHCAKEQQSIASELIELLEHFQQANAKVIEQAEKVNEYAERCGKPKI